MEGMRKQRGRNQGVVSRTMLTVLTMLATTVATAGTARGEYLAVYPTAGGQLKELIGDKLMTIDSLVVEGPMDHTDFATIHPATVSGRLAVVNLEHADIDGDSVPSGAFAANAKAGYYSEATYKVEYCETVLRRVILPDNLRKIGPRAFRMAQKLESVNLPDSLEEIGREAFAMVERHETPWPIALRTIGPKLPSKLRKLGSNAFGTCEHIEEIEIPEGMTELGDSAFWACRGIKTLILPSTMDSIGAHCFARLVNLRQIICKAQKPPTCHARILAHQYFFYYPIWGWGDRNINSIYNEIAYDRTCRDVMVYIPRESLSHYHAGSSQWNYFYWDNLVEVDDFSTLHSGIEEIHGDASFNVSCSPGRIIVNVLTTSESYHVYGMAGAVRRSGMLHSGDNTIEITPGIYILRVGTDTRKILVP